MEFQIEKNSPIPVIKQLQEQIKLSIAMGMLKRGDLLPPIREVEKQTGINRGQIHRAYLALQKSGLLSTAQSKRMAVAVSAKAPDSMNQKCRELANDVVKQIRKIGVSPSAFVRFLGRRVQEDERGSSYIAYVDPVKEFALRRADQLSRLWQAPISGLSIDEFKRLPAHGNNLRKVLANHLSADTVRRGLRGRKIDIISIEIRYSAQTIKALKRLKASAVLLLMPENAVLSARFIVDQLHRWLERESSQIAWMPAEDVTDFEALMNDPKYDYILVSPGAQKHVPVKLHKNPHLVFLQMDLDPEALEIARIQAGVIL